MPAKVPDFFRAAHLSACVRAGVLPDDPCFDDGYFHDCAAMLAMIERGASVDEIEAYDAASAGVFDGWRDWFTLTMLEVAPIPATGARLGASEAVAAPNQPKTPKSPVRP